MYSFPKRILTNKKKICALIVNRNVCQSWKLKNAKGMLPKD